MSFYKLSKSQREILVADMQRHILLSLQENSFASILAYFADPDTYMRKSAYLVTGRIYFAEPSLRPVILVFLQQAYRKEDFKIRQTVINTAGEIGCKTFGTVQFFFDRGLFDPHHSPRNAVIGSVKKMGAVNPEPVLAWAKTYLHHPDKEIRREICHGIELRGRKFPGDILPLLKELEWDRTARVRNTLVHVLGQIAYKKDCLATVVTELQHWQNKELVADALEEIIDVHHRYRNFAAMSQDEARNYINNHFITVIHKT